MEKRAGQLIYKCRRCGETFGSVCSGDIGDVLLMLMVRGDHPMLGAFVSDRERHFCADKRGIGIGDCIGAEYDAPDAD